MFSRSILALAALAALSPAAQAEQFVAERASPFLAANAELLAALHVTEIDSYALNGRHYLVIDAPDEGYVEAYFFATHQPPLSLHRIGADWTGPGLATLSLEARQPFLTAAPCDFCRG